MRAEAPEFSPGLSHAAGPMFAEAPARESLGDRSHPALRQECCDKALGNSSR